MARPFPPDSPRLRRAGLAVVVALVLVGMTTYSLIVLPGGTTPRLAMVDAVPSTLPGPSAADPTDAPSPDPTAEATVTGTSTGSGSVNSAANDTGSPPGQWQYADDTGPMYGTAGPVYTFRIAVESGLPVSAAEFTGTVDSTLGDWRSWAGAGTLRMQHVPGGSASNFTIYLAQPWTAYALCQTTGIDIRVGGVPYTSCQAGAKVVINSDRYLGGVGGYGASLTVYRQYAINHEVGHRLGHGHVSCPGAGELAPVMQQQTISLQGCVANAWPYPNAEPPPAPPTPPDPTTPPPTTTPPATPTATPTGTPG